MINAAIIKNGIVENVIVLNSLDEVDGAVECPEWVGIGMDINTPKPTPVPQSVTRAQARKALAIQGLFSSVQPAIDSIEDPLQRQLAQIDWDDSLTYERNNATLAMLAEGLGLSEQQLDELFILAAQQP